MTDACPFTAGYWCVPAPTPGQFAGNQRMAQALHGLERLRDLDKVLADDPRG